MGRQHQKRNSDRSSSSASGTDLLNFHFSSGPPPQQQQQQQQQQNRRRNSSGGHHQHHYNNHNYNNNSNNNRRKSSASSSSSSAAARKKKPTNSNQFNLHTSSDHSFVITRHGLKSQQYSFSGSDEAVSWESVRMVKCFVSSSSSSSSSKQQPQQQQSSSSSCCCCPICLDTLVCPRITKCGHYYCLPCILRHVQVHGQSNPYCHVKCPCCGVPLHVSDLRPVILMTIQTPRLHRRISLVKLHRTKDCPSPYLPLPNTPKRSSIHAAPTYNQDIDAPFCRFNYVDCTTYQEHLTTNKIELETELATLTKPQQQQQQQRRRQPPQSYNNNYNNNNNNRGRPSPPPTTTTHHHHQQQQQQQRQRQQQQQYQQNVELIFLTSALEMVQKEIHQAKTTMMTLNDEGYNQEKELIESFSSPGSGVYQQQPQQLMAMNYEFTKLPPPVPPSKSQQPPPSPLLTPQHDDNHNQEEITYNKNKNNNGNGTARATAGPPAADGDNDINNLGRPRQESVVGSVECSSDFPSTTNTRRESVGSESEINNSSAVIGGRYRGDSIGSYASIDGGESCSTSGGGGGATSGQKKNHRGGNNKKQRPFPKASMYLDDEGSSHFYQSQDGQLVFLSRFNMSCISYDFSSKVPEVPTQNINESMTTTTTTTTDQQAVQKDKDTALTYWQRRKLLPLPDTVEGEILEIENVHLTPDMRKRMPFLAHLPLYTDIQFVELDLNNLLSIDCKKKFRGELEKRRKRRQSKVKAEKREDKMAQKKEEERINELKARMQRIDPNDEFFQVSVPEEPLDLTGDAFGPAISGGGGASEQPPAVTAAVANRQPAFSFSNVCQSGGAFPSLTANSEENFPALGSSPPSSSRSGLVAPTVPTWGSPPRTTNQQQPTWGQSSRPTPGWGSPSRPNPAPTVSPVATESRPSEVSKQPPMPKSKKKSKGKKIVLFSSGGQRGTSY